MATVQKIISESGSLTTRTLTTTISAPGIRQDAEINVSPNVDASKVSYVINEAAGTIEVTLTQVGYTRDDSYSYEYIKNWPLVSQYTEPDGSGIGYFRYCVYGDGTVINAGGGTTGFPAPSCPSSYEGVDIGYVKRYHFGYTVTVTYKSFPEFHVRQSSQLKTAADGWVRVNGQLRQIQQIWVRVNGNLKEV